MVMNQKIKMQDNYNVDDGYYGYDSGPQMESFR